MVTTPDHSHYQPTALAMAAGKHCYTQKPLVRRVVRWLAAVAEGHPDRKRILFQAEFVPGGSIAPVWKG